MVLLKECPQCGGPITDSSAQKCEYCGSEFFVDSLAYLGRFDPNDVKKYLASYTTLINKHPNDTDGLLGLGLCHLQLGTYPFAQKQFKQIIETSPEVPPAYYYYILASIQERRLMTLPLSEVRQFETYLRTAILLDGETSKYRLLFAMLKRDYYEANGMKVPPPSAAELLRDLSGKSIDENEVRQLMQSVKVSGLDDYFSGLSIV